MVEPATPGEMGIQAEPNKRQLWSMLQVWIMKGKRRQLNRCRCQPHHHPIKVFNTRGSSQPAPPFLLIAALPRSVRMKGRPIPFRREGVPHEVRNILPALRWPDGDRRGAASANHAHLPLLRPQVADAEIRRRCPAARHHPADCLRRGRAEQRTRGQGQGTDSRFCCPGIRWATRIASRPWRHN